MQKTSHAIFNRIYVRAGLLAALVGGLPLISHAGYAQLAPPERFSGGAYPDFKFAPSANDARYGKIAFQKDGLRLPIPGKNVTMPAAYRFAANAPRFAAAAIFLSPHLRLAVGIASWLGIAGLVWDEVNQRWTQNEGLSVTDDQRNSAGYLWSVASGSPFVDSQSAACQYDLNLIKSAYPYLSSTSVGSDGSFLSCIHSGMNGTARIEIKRRLQKKPADCPAG